MCRHSFVFCFLLAVSAIAVHAQSSDLPSGPAEAKFRTACTECHEARIIVQQRLSKGAWTKEVDKMIKWGAVVDAADHDAFIDYLSANFSVDKPIYIAEKTSAASSGKKK